MWRQRQLKGCLFVCLSTLLSLHYVGGIWKQRFLYENAKKKNQFRSHGAGGISKRTNHRSFGFEETRLRKSRDFRDVIVCEKLHFFQNVFRLHENVKPAFSNFPGLERVFKKLRFWRISVVGLTVEIKLRSQISLEQCRRCLESIVCTVNVECLSVVDLLVSSINSSPFVVFSAKLPLPKNTNYNF